MTPAQLLFNDDRSASIKLLRSIWLLIQVLHHATTIKQVAERAGVSTSTVSHVLNGTHFVSPPLTERVLRAVELDYQLKRVARSLAGGRSSVIGLMIPELAVSYSGEILRGIDEALANAGYDLLLHTTHNQRVKERVFVHKLAHGLTEGLLLLLPSDPNAYLAPLYKKQFPYVVIDHQGFDDFSPTVVSTNWQGAFEATRYLIELGHRRIGFVAGASHTSSALERLQGYRDALQRAGFRSTMIWCAKVISRARRHMKRRCTCSIYPIRRPRSSPPTMCRRLASSTRSTPAGCAFRTMSR